MNFFQEKLLIKFSCAYYPLSFCKILKKFLKPILNYEDVPFSGPKQPICPEQKCFGTSHYYYFHLPIGPFHCAKFKKIPTTDPEFRGCALLGSKWPICPNFFLRKSLITFSSTYQPLSLCKVFKKFFQWIHSYEDAQFLGPKWPISTSEIFLFSDNLLMSLISFIHAYLHAKNQSQILIYQ